MWKEAVMVEFEVLFQQLSGELKKIVENLSQDNQCEGQDSNDTASGLAQLV
jgi:hypothetical protein